MVRWGLDGREEEGWTREPGFSLRPALVLSDLLRTRSGCSSQDDALYDGLACRENAQSLPTPSFTVQIQDTYGKV